MIRLAKRIWLPLVLSVVAALGGYAVVQTRGMFIAGTMESGEPKADDTKPFNPKRVTYEITGAPSGSASINYLDENGQSNLVDRVSLPWSFTIETTLPSMSANIVAQASADVDSLRCRVIVDGQVRDDRLGNQYEPFIYCLVKSV